MGLEYTAPQEWKAPGASGSVGMVIFSVVPQLPGTPGENWGWEKDGN